MKTNEVKNYPIIFNIKEDVVSCTVNGNHLHLRDKDGRTYRLKNTATMVKVLKGEITKLYPKHYYWDWYLFEKPPQKSLKEHETTCTVCNGHGYTWYNKCKTCNGTGAINWIENVFKKEEK